MEPQAGSSRKSSRAVRQPHKARWLNFSALQDGRKGRGAGASRGLEESWNQIKRRTLPPTFERAGSAWLEAEKPHLAERTYEIYEVALRCHLKPALGSPLLCDIDANRIASYQARRKAEKASALTLNKELQVLRQILKRYKLWANRKV